MTEAGSPLEGGPDAPGGADDVLDQAPTRSRTTVLLAGAGAVAVLALGGVLLLGGGTDETDVSLTTTTAPAPVGPAAGGASPTPSAASPTPSAATPARPARDPFAPLERSATQVEPSSGAAAPATGAGVGAPVTGVQPVGTGPVLDDDPLPPVDPGTGGTVGAPSDGGVGAAPPPLPSPPPTPVAPAPARRLALTAVGGTADAPTAVLSIDGDEATVRVGARFGPALELLLISVQDGPEPGQSTAVVQVGDGAPFDVVTGTPVTLP